MNIEYMYEELVSRALSGNATQDDINELGNWFERYGQEYWNGECYDIDGRHTIAPVYEWDEEADQGELIRFDLN